jgi:TatD DNase family protein
VTDPAMDLVDIGVNLAHDSFDADRVAVIARARMHGVRRMIVTGSSLSSSDAAMSLAPGTPGLVRHGRRASAPRG